MATIVPGSGTALYSDLGTRDECQLHSNVLELRAVDLTLLHLEQKILDQTIQIESDNMATVSYINRQGGVVAQTSNDEACSLFSATNYQQNSPRSNQQTKQPQGSGQERTNT